MADGVEPPPMDEEEDQKSDDELFPETKKKIQPNLNSEDLFADEPPSLPVTTDKAHVNNTEDDLFGSTAANTEVKLDDSDEEEEVPPVASAPEPEPSKADAPVLEETKKEEKPPVLVSHSSTAVSKSSGDARQSKDEPEEEETDQFTMEISVIDPCKMGDGMGAYMVYKVKTKTSIPAFRKPELVVTRRFSDFLGLHSRLQEKHAHLGIIVPPAPEKSVLGMTKIKMSKEESGSSDFVERRRAALERYLSRTAQHPVLRTDPDVQEFLERDGDLPKSTSTSALSGAGVMRLFHKMGDAVEKITFKMDENDEWFEEKQQQIEALDQQLRKLHASVEALSMHRRELSLSTAVFAKSAAMLGSVEEHTALSRALSQLAETEEKIEQLHKEQADMDFFTMAELMKDYVSLLGAVREVFHDRVKIYKNWKEAESMLMKKRDAKAKLEIQHKSEKVPQAQQEITEWEEKVEKGQEEFEKMSSTVRKEIARFEKYRVIDFKNSVVKYLEAFMEGQQKLIKYWEAFLPEAKAIA
ncbi:sorting nexin-2-like isoform X2 [Gigantopelta aegis]|uniref:sorting nexin-2-like isoform X2 n=1 Tax=Gigantopelta aegis TaxID=1735272 RepID=UPI001B88846E|nr:sorting nexin-2-like isoform X2 [Gigantopelta aegis]